MNFYIIFDVSSYYLPPQPSFFEEKKIKDLKIGDYVKLGSFNIYEFKGTFLSDNHLYLSMLTRFGEKQDMFSYPPEYNVRVLNPPYKLGDYVQIEGKFDWYLCQIKSISGEDNRAFYYFCSPQNSQQRPIHFSTNGDLNVKLYRRRDEDTLQAILSKLDSMEARLTRLESLNRYS